MPLRKPVIAQSSSRSGPLQKDYKSEIVFAPISTVEVNYVGLESSGHHSRVGQSCRLRWWRLGFFIRGRRCAAFTARVAATRFAAASASAATSRVTACLTAAPASTAATCSPTLCGRSVYQHDPNIGRGFR